MSSGVSERARRVWDEWNIRGAVLGSLFFQIGLTVLSNSRRSSRRKAITAIIWAFYLLADWIAAFAVGLISSGQSNKRTSVNKQLAAYWAPFLLLHLGGPDAITAFSLEDNELWIRHLMGFLFQVAAVVYVFFQSLSNEYWIPTVVLFFAGACRYLERTIALFRACLGNFKRSLLLAPNPGPNYALLMDELSTLEAYGVRYDIVIEDKAQAESATYGGAVAPVQLDHTDVVLRGYRFFKTFKGLIVDQILTMDVRDDSRFFFLRTDALDAFRVMEVELNFIYDVLYTKTALVHSKFGYLFRFICTALIVASFLLFASLPKHDIHHFDKIVTYVLLVGAVALDVLGLSMLLFSDWTVVSATAGVARFLTRVPLIGKRRARWSNEVARHSFISFCFNRDRFQWLNRVANFLKFNDNMDEFLHVGEEACEEDLKKFIFDELKAKAAKAPTPESAKEMSAVGAFLLSDISDSNNIRSCPSILRSFGDDVEYDETLLLWHIATELCYFTRPKPKIENKDDQDREARIANCKLISDYMLYLLIMRPALMSAVVGIARIRFQDTCEETRKFFERLPEGMTGSVESSCKKLMRVRTHIKLDEVKGNSSKSLLFSACMLASELNKRWEDQNKRWEMIGKVWVDLLSYGATRCSSSDHARGLSQGGELITFVWLLMVHFGLGDNFKLGALGRAKLIVHK